MKRLIAKILIAVVAFAAVTVPFDVSQAYTGYVKVGKYYYYYSSKGKMKTGYQKINGKGYYFKKNGRAAAKGWINHSNGNKRYSYGKGRIAIGYKKIGKYYYYFNSKGIMQKYFNTIDDTAYYFKKNGRAAAKGWVNHSNGTKRYSYGKGKLAIGYVKIGNYYYYFDSKGIMQTHMQTIDGKPYCFDENGRGLLEGWIKYEDGNKRYCLGNGQLAVGTVKLEGKSCYFDETGLYKPNYLVKETPGTYDTEITYAEKTYKMHCQFSRNYEGYNDYLASHGCAVTSLTCILGAYVEECRDWTPDETITIAEKNVAGTAFKTNYKKKLSKQMPVSLYGISKVLDNYDISHIYVQSFETDKEVKADIKAHLKNGYPVMFIVSQKNRETGKTSSKWTNSYHTMVMIGIDKKDNVLIGNPAGSQRLQMVSLDEIIDYMWSCTDEPDGFYWNGKKRCGGYIKITE